MDENKHLGFVEQYLEIEGVPAPRQRAGTAARALIPSRWQASRGDSCELASPREREAPLFKLKITVRAMCSFERCLNEGYSFQ